MKTAQEILKLSGLLFLLPGTLLVIIPEEINVFLNAQDAIPKVVILFCGIALNLSGLLLLQFAKQANFSARKKTITAIVHLFAVIFAVIGFLADSWVTTVNGMTIVGLYTIVTGWLGWQIFMSTQT